MSGQRDEATDSAAEWLAHADRDLLMAERGLEPPPIVDLVCYHAEQAAEKALKAYLVALGEERIPRTHSFRKLTELIRARGGTPPPGQLLAPLQSYATTIRYPGGPVVTPAAAEEAIGLAREVLAFVRQSVGLENDA
jgi:HEPN domain-containing protein